MIELITCELCKQQTIFGCEHPECAVKLALTTKAFHDWDIPSYAENEVKQEWDCHVTEIGDTTFYAHMVDLTFGGTNERGDFEISELSDEQKSLLKVGQVFKLTMTATMSFMKS